MKPFLLTFCLAFAACTSDPSPQPARPASPPSNAKSTSPRPTEPSSPSADSAAVAAPVAAPVAAEKVPAAKEKPPVAEPSSTAPSKAIEPVKAAPNAPAAPMTQAAGPGMTSDDGKSIFGKALYVNGRRVTDNQIKLWIIYGPCRSMLESYRINLIIDEELTRHAADLADKRVAEVEKERPFTSPDEKAKFRSDEFQRQHQNLIESTNVAPEDVQKEYDRTVADFKRKYPILDSEAEISRAYRSPDWYRFQLSQTLHFDRVFLPYNPDDWPEVTTQAVLADSGPALVDDAKSSYENRRKWQEEHGGDFPPEDNIYATMMRQIVRDAMFGTIDFKTSFADLPDSIALTADTNADGRPELTVMTEEVWQRIAPSVSEQEINDAKAYYQALYATQDRLQKEGNLIDAAGRANVLKATLNSLVGTYLNVDILAQNTQYFPSTETYLEYLCLIEGLKKSIKDKLDPGPGGDLNPALREHYDRAVKIMGLGQVDAEVLLCAAFDIPKAKWKPDGWTWAKKRAEEVLAKVKANDEAWQKQLKEETEAKAAGKEYKPENPAVEPYRFWTDLMNEFSDWWDPPSPENAHPMSELAMKKKGRFGERYRHDLEGVLGETKYKHWVKGFSVTDQIFFEQPVGSVQGPFPAQLGYYVTRVNKRNPPSRTLNLADPKHVELVKDDFLKYELVRYTKEALAQAKIEER